MDVCRQMSTASAVLCSVVGEEGEADAPIDVITISPAIRACVPLSTSQILGINTLVYTGSSSVQDFTRVARGDGSVCARYAFALPSKLLRRLECTLMSGVSYSVVIGQSLQGAAPRAPEALLGQLEANARHQTKRGFRWLSSPAFKPHRPSPSSDRSTPSHQIVVDVVNEPLR